MKNWIKKTLQDETGAPSSSRQMAVGGSFLVFIAFAINFFYKIEINVDLLHTIETIIGLGFGKSVLDKISQRFGTNNSNNQTNS